MSDHCQFNAVRRLLGLALGVALIVAAMPARASEAVGMSSGFYKRPDGFKATGFAKGHALVVAIANYQHVNSLPPAVLNDGQQFYNLLTSQEYCGYLPGNVKRLLDGEATSENIRDALKDLARDTKPDDTVVIFFSGHGGRIESQGKEESFLLPVNFDLNQAVATGLSSDEFTKLLAAIKAERVVVLLDARHAAGASELKAVVPASGIKAGLSSETYDALAKGRGRVIMASSEESEYSVIKPGATNSLFTEQLLEALKGSAGSTGDGTIRIFDVFRYLALKIPLSNTNQHPLLQARLVDDFAVSLFKGGSKEDVGGLPRPKPEPVTYGRPTHLPGPIRVELSWRLVSRWSYLAYYLDIPLSDRRKFPQGDEPEAIIDWLEERGRLLQLRSAFQNLNYPELIPIIDRGLQNLDPDPRASTPTAPEDEDRIIVTRKILGVLEQIRPNQKPGEVVQSVQGVLNGLDKEQLGKLLEGEVSESKNFLRYSIANAFEIIASASLARFQHQEALSAYREQYKQLDPIYAANPRWQPLQLPAGLANPVKQSERIPNQMQPSRGFLSPVCELVFFNRLNYCAGLNDSSDSRVDDATRDEIRSALKVAVDAIRRINAPKFVRADLYFMISMSDYMIDDLDRAEDALGQAMIEYGTLPPEAIMEDEDRVFLSKHHLLLSAILAEHGDAVGAIRMIAAAKPFVTTMFDVRGVAGYDYLLISRISKDPSVIALGIENAVQELDNDHEDVSCRYNLACALAKRSQGEASVSKDRDLQRATELLLSVIKMLKSSPIEPQVSAIRKDPFLERVLALPEVAKALDGFKWSPRPIGPPAPMDGLWHFGVPLRGFRFTRLNGDKRN